MQRPIIVLSHDPYARQSLIRQCNGRQGECAWCGGRSGNGLTYRYGVQGDSLYARPNFSPRVFCSVQCWRTYNGR